MPTIKRFEDLECWQEARKLVKLIYSAIKANPEFQKDFRWSSSLFTHPTLPNHQSNLNDPNDQNDLNAPIEHKEKKLKNEILSYFLPLLCIAQLRGLGYLVFVSLCASVADYKQFTGYRSSYLIHNPEIQFIRDRR